MRAKNMWKLAVVAVLFVGGVWVESSAINDHPYGALLRGDELIRPGRIVHGEPYKEDEPLYQVSIQEKIGDKHKHFCGGTLISADWIVTAAHCSRYVNAENLRVVTGTCDLHKKHNAIYKVKKIITGPYNQMNFKNDIALMKLIVPKTKSAQKGIPIGMETRKESFTGQKCIVSGWGRMSSGGKLPMVLLATDVKIRTDKECRAMFDMYSHYTIHNENVCAGGGDRDACQGDSGGPLVCCDGTSRDVKNCWITGITSWGIGCATRGIPGVYTEIAHYCKWIQEQIEKEDGKQATTKLRFRSFEDMENNEEKSTEEEGTKEESTKE